MTDVNQCYFPGFFHFFTHVRVAESDLDFDVETCRNARPASIETLPGQHRLNG